ncbi:MAG: respiratory nitrate reductase subunit gamma, partial [Rhodobacteraceae bacterium]|nr:respiratory nitrate reductase subunit gamma [Paracoccaceae bacterium]
MHNFIFGIYPYIALTVLIFGSIARYETEPFTWKSSSSQLLRRKQLIMGSVLFHIGVLVIFAGHLFGLLTPIAIFDTLGISHGAKQTLAIVAGGVAGVMALIGGGMLFHRRMSDPRIRATSAFADIAILALLLAQLVLGLG